MKLYDAPIYSIPVQRRRKPNVTSNRGPKGHARHHIRNITNPFTLYPFPFLSSYTPSQKIPLLPQSVADNRIDAVIRRAEASQLHSLAILNLLSVGVSPLDGDVAVRIGVDEDVEGAVAAELGEEGDGGGDLAEDGGDFGLDFGLGLFFVGEVGVVCGRGVFLLLLLVLFVGWGGGVCGGLFGF